MNCKEARRWISPYLDSELGKTKTFELSEHLRICSGCTERFEAERRADDAVRSCLQRTEMPSELWRRISQKVSAPSLVRRWFYRHRLAAGGTLAVAACLALLLLLGLGIVWKNSPADGRSATGGTPADSQPWPVREFVAVTPGNRSFTGSEDDRAAIDDVFSGLLGVTLASLPLPVDNGHFGLKLVSAARRVDEHGRSFVELRLNCCDQPVLIMLARSSDGGWPVPLDGLQPAARLSVHTEGGALGTVGNVRIAVRDVDGVRVVAVSRHPVEHLLSRMNLEQV